METWVWLVIIIVAALGFYLWKQVQEGQKGAEEIIASGSFENAILDDMVQKGRLPAEGDAETYLVYGMLAIERGNTDTAIKAFRRSEELGSPEASRQLDRLLEREDIVADA